LDKLETTKGGRSTQSKGQSAEVSGVLLAVGMTDLVTGVNVA